MTRVVVTGAASGLGLAIAARYARAGARVLLTDVDGAAGRAAAARLGAPFEALDVRADEDWQRVRDWCLAHWDGADILVNNAGVGAGGRLERLPWSHWQWVLDINLAGVVRGCRTFVPLFQRQGNGHLVNVASMAGQVVAAVAAGRFWVLPHRAGRRAWWLQRHLPWLVSRRPSVDWARLLPRLRRDQAAATTTDE